MVRLAVTLRPKSACTAQDLLDALRACATTARLEPDCLGCSVASGPDGVRYVEEWASEADARRRIRSDRFTSVLSVVESAAESRVEFEFITRTRGLDYVAEVRNMMNSPWLAETPAVLALAWESDARLTSAPPTP